MFSNEFQAKSEDALLIIEGIKILESELKTNHKNKDI